MSVWTPRYPKWRLRHEGAYTSLLDVLLEIRGLAPADVANTPDVLHDPLLMRDMDRAVETIRGAVDGGRRIVVHGDYDVDGVTSTALMLDYLERLGADALPVLPHRTRDGYGLKPAGVERAVELGAGLIVAVDNGISAFDAVAEAARAGVDVVIVDHHLPHEKLPEAAAVVDPNRPDCPYPFKGLAAVGLVFKLVQAASDGTMESAERRRYLNGLLDLVALGTVADVAPMIGENRFLTRHGLRVLARGDRPGPAALRQVAKAGGREVDATAIGYILGPRLNSAGRLASADLALELLRTADRQEAVSLAEELDGLNRRRRDLQDAGVEAAFEQVESAGLAERKIVVVRGDDWHLGVIGLIAGRLAEAFGRPAAVCSGARRDGLLVGSARTAAGYDIGEAIFRAAEYLDGYGGHAAAAGFQLEEGRFEAFRGQLEADAERSLSDEDLEAELVIDAELEASDVALDTVERLAELAPFGAANEAPRFMARNCRVESVRTVGRESEHLKLRLDAGRGVADAVWWREGARAADLQPGDRLDAAFVLEANHWNGRTRLQLRLDDLRLATPAS